MQGKLVTVLLLTENTPMGFCTSCSHATSNGFQLALQSSTAAEGMHRVLGIVAVRHH